MWVLSDFGKLRIYLKKIIEEYNLEPFHVPIFPFNDWVKNVYRKSSFNMVQAID